MTAQITEYRVIGTDREHGQVFEEVDYEGRDIDEARYAYNHLKTCTPPFDQIRFQRRTITTSSWRSVPKRERTQVAAGEEHR